MCSSRKKRKDRQRARSPDIERAAEDQRREEELKRKRALYEEASMSLGAYGAWAYPVDTR